MQFTPLGGGFTANFKRDGIQRYSDVVALEGGKFVTVWSDGDNAIRAHIFSGTGGAEAKEPLVNDPNDALRQDAPAVAALSGGGFVAVWRNLQTGIQAQRFDASGAKIGSMLRVTDADKAYQDKPAVTALANGAYAVSWEGRVANGGVSNIFTQVVDGHGDKIGGSLQVTAAGGSFGALNSTVAKLGSGGFVVAWQDDSSGKQIKAQLFTAAGAKQGIAFTIDTGAVSAASPSIVALKSGGFAAAWAVSDTQGSYAIEAQTFDGNGKAIGPAAQVLAPTTTYASNPDVAALPDGGFAVSWQVMDHATSDTDVFARTFNASGGATGGAFKLNAASGAGNQTYAELAVNKDGTLMAVWTDQDGGTIDVKGQVFKSDFVRANSSPVVNPEPDLRLQDLQLTEDKSLNIIVSDDAFVDADGDQLRYELTLADGKALPSWIKFYDYDHRLIVKPPANYNGEVALKMTATDGKASASDVFKVNVAKVNDAPVLKNPLPDVSIQEGKNWMLKLPKNAFFDADYDQLTVTLSGGSGLGGGYWTQALSLISIINGIIIDANHDVDFVGAMDIAVKVSDGKKSVSDKFVLNVKNVADAPIISSGPDRDGDGWGDNDGTKASYSIEENSRGVITRFTVDDPDPSTKLTYALTGTDAFRFLIDGKGDLRFRNPVDFETPLDGGKDKASLKNNIYDLTVTVSDGKLKDSQAVAVKIEDVKPRTKPGTASANKITGTTEGDKLDGKGGNDTLTGLGGDDLFVFSTKLDSMRNVDTITDFRNHSSEDDRIGLDIDIFRNLREMGRDTGNKSLRDCLHEHDFKVVGSLTDKNIDRSDRILYDRMDGDLYYDRDGSETHYKPVKFAEIATKANLIWSDFVLA